MAGETTTATADDAVFSEWMDEMILEELRPLQAMRGTFRFRDKRASNIFSFTLIDDPGAATVKGEGASVAPTSLTTSKAQVTAATVGFKVTLTRELTAISIFDAYETFGPVAVRSVAEKFETDATGLLDDFTNRTGTSGVDYTWAQRNEAITALANRDISGLLVEVIHTQQVGDLQQDMTTSTAAIWGNPDIQIDGMAVNERQAFVFNAFGVPTLQTSLVPTADAGANRNGAIYALDHALGHYEIWPSTSETDTDIDLPGTEVVVTERFGVGVVRNTAGQGIKTDA